MADFIAEFKKLAETFQKSIKLLERTYNNPLTFYGTTHRRTEAEELMKGKQEVVRRLTECIQEDLSNWKTLSMKTSEEIIQSKELLNECEDLAELLEEHGFKLNSEKPLDNPNEEDENEHVARDDNIRIHDDLATLSTKHPNITVEANDKSCKYFPASETKDYAVETVDEVHWAIPSSEAFTDQITQSTEKYLERNNLDLDDIVTPYFQRTSILGKKTGF